MKQEVNLIENRARIIFNSYLEAIEHRVKDSPPGTIFVIFDGPESDAAKMIKHLRPNSLTVYFQKQPGEDKSIWGAQIPRVITNLTKSGAPISIHLPLNSKAGEALIPIVEYGLELANNPAVLKNQAPLFEIDGSIPAGYFTRVMKVIKQGKADAIF
jgi:hypothetical protein